MKQKAKSMSTFTNLPFEVTTAADKPAQMGLVTLETDLTIETEMRHFLSGAPGHDDASGVALLAAGCAPNPTVTAITIQHLQLYSCMISS